MYLLRSHIIELSEDHEARMVCHTPSLHPISNMISICNGISKAAVRFCNHGRRVAMGTAAGDTPKQAPEQLIGAASLNHG
jgi:hypothetical protein